jgi:TatD DNase family protein
MPPSISVGVRSLSFRRFDVELDGLPPLDCHAHLAPDVTAPQLTALGSAQIVAVTRSIAEATAARGRRDVNIAWGCGVHPGDRGAIRAYDGEAIRGLVPAFAVVGEVGLDRRAGGLDAQVAVLEDILDATAGAPVILSVHASGAEERVVDLLERVRRGDAILHWFLGSPGDVRRAIGLGCYFSVSSVIDPSRLEALPVDRVLPETDFPATRRRGGGDMPGDTSGIERTLSVLWRRPETDVRRQLYRNLRDLAARSGALDHLPENLSDQLLLA